MTRPRFEVEAYIWRTAGTASAGSPRVSTALQANLWPRTPPAALIALVDASQETRYVGPEGRVGPGERRHVGDRQRRSLGGAAPTRLTAAARATSNSPAPREEQGRRGTGSAPAAWLLRGSLMICVLTWLSPLVGPAVRYSVALSDAGGTHGQPSSHRPRPPLGWRSGPAPRSPPRSGRRGAARPAACARTRRPPGVPVAITSPSRRVVNEDTYSIVRGMSKIICAVLADCMTSPLSVVVSCRSDASSSSAVTTSGPIGIVAVEVLARSPLRGRALPLPRRPVHHDHVAGDRGERVLGADVAPAGADHDAQLALVVKARAQVGLDRGPRRGRRRSRRRGRTPPATWSAGGRPRARARGS